MKSNNFALVNEATKFLSKEVEDKLNQHIKQQEHAVLILPGGNSIKTFFPELIKINVDWNKITIGLSDERLVPKDHEMSNEKQLRELFLRFLPTYNFCELNPELIDKIKKYNPITILSMGDDGHVASLFPEEYEYWKDCNDFLYTTVNKNPARISMSDKGLLLSKEVYTLVMGKSKNDFLDKEKSNLKNMYSFYNNINWVRC